MNKEIKMNSIQGPFSSYMTDYQTLIEESIRSTPFVVEQINEQIRSKEIKDKSNEANESNEAKVVEDLTQDLSIIVKNQGVPVKLVAKNMSGAQGESNNKDLELIADDDSQKSCCYCW